MNNQNNHTTNDRMEQALFYCNSLNWNIILIGKDKKPLEEWKQYQTKRITSARIKTWFLLYPEAHIAVITGKVSNLTVVDIDPRHNGSYKPFEDISTVKSKTGGDGYHIFFQYEEGVSNKAGIQQGIDLRSEAGYVILPPSIHKSGKKYEWITAPSADFKLPKLPPFIKKLLNKSANTLNQPVTGIKRY
ncbi:MAG TPA: bifunctional DNA primase/polymerase [Candidatus Nitrosocosmicus sp.]|nr:bifunctional DNA primase/polymerase [Candidatus Nitrosocosmicus sp.]